TGAFDIQLGNASSELKIMGSGGTYYAILDAGNITDADKIITMPNTTGTVLLDADIGSSVQAYNASLAAIAGGTWTGAASITTLGTIGTGVWNGTAVDTAHGGIGLSSYTAGDMLYYSSGTTFTAIPAGSNGQIFGWVGSAPTWQNSPFIGAHNLLSLSHPDTVAASPLSGDLVTGVDSGGGAMKWTRLAVGSSGYFLTNNGTTLSWSDTNAITRLGTVAVGAWGADVIADAFVANNLTISSGTISASSIALTQSAAPTPTAEGRIEWDTDDNYIVVGNGAAQSIFYPGGVTMSGASDYITLSGQDIVRGLVDLAAE
ncbi:TPA: hypothetical protein DCL22_01545, partial [Candidatus Moranbacteria bacterium]|nr:hypothetical protein [Candidatus Moranbacteria bacterium]